MPAKKTILVVEDDPNDVDLLRHAFEKLGSNKPLQVCADGHGALEYLDGKGRYADRKKFPMPFMVILDWKLSEDSGLEVITGIRSRPAMAKLCVVVLTSSDYPNDREAALKAGADLFLLKPMGHFLEVAKTILTCCVRPEPPE